MGLIGMLAGLALCASANEGAARPTVEVVFVLDTTGSMDGLLEAAKQKVWAVANEIARGKPSPRVRMGLVGYRDKGDDYLTRVHPLTDDLDETYSHLLALRAGGGGDGPEHVVAALSDAVDKMSWSSDPKALKLVYLVGDAPPHFDYAEAPKLEPLLQRAVRRGIVFNAIQCGSDSQTQESWQRIARLGEGKYLAIAHDGGVASVSTPFDEKLAKLDRALDATSVSYGRHKAKAEARRARAAGLSYAAAPAAAADRASFMAAAESFRDEEDLGAAAASGKLDLAKVNEAELPDDWKGLSADERKAKAGALNAEREKLRREIEALSKKRADFLKKAAPAKDGFDAALVGTLKEQAAAKGIAY